VDVVVVDSVDADGVGGRGSQANEVNSSLRRTVFELERSDLDDELLGDRGNTRPLEADDTSLTSTSVGKGWNWGVGLVG